MRAVMDMFNGFHYTGVHDVVLENIGVTKVSYDVSYLIAIVPISELIYKIQKSTNLSIFNI